MVRRRLLFAGMVLLGGTVGLAALGARAPVVDGKGLCAAPDARLLVDLGKHTLALCEKDRARGTFAVRLGRGGIGKTREG